MTSPQDDPWFGSQQEPKHKGLLGEMEKHPAITTGAALASVPVGIRTHGDVQAIRSIAHLKDPERGAKLVSDLAQHRSEALPGIGGGKGVADVLRGQREIHQAAKAGNRDIGALRPTVNRYSRTFEQAGKIKAAGNKPVHGFGGALAHPIRAERGLHARVLGGLIDNAKEGEHPHLYRSQHNVGTHQVGDTVDFGRFSSFTSDRAIAQHTGAAHEAAKLMPGKPTTPEGSKGVIYHLPAGTGKAANLSGATNRFAQNEWMAGGKYQVTDVKGSHVYLGAHPDSVGKRWEKQGGGWTKKGAPAGKGGHIEDPGQYEAVKRATGSKRIAAAVSNTPHQVHRKNIFKASVYSASSQGAIAQEQANERQRARSHAVAAGAVGNLIGTGAFLGHQQLKHSALPQGAEAAARRAKQLEHIKHAGFIGTAGALGAAGAYAMAGRHHRKEARAAARNVENLKQNPPTIFHSLSKANGFGIDEELVMAYQAPLAKGYGRSFEPASLPPGTSGGTSGGRKSGQDYAREMQNRNAREQAYRRRRNTAKPPMIGVGKAFDSERQRHRRRAAYEGAAAGGSVSAAAGAGYLGHKARGKFGEAGGERAQATELRGRAEESLRSLPPRKRGAAATLPPKWQDTARAASRDLTRAHAHQANAVKLAGEARKFRAGAVGAGVASAGAAYGAYKLHRQGQNRGRSYAQGPANRVYGYA